MRNNTFCCGVFYTRCTALMRDRGYHLPIFLQEVSICIIHHGTIVLSVATAQGTRVPILNGSPPL
jgi:hypothetical protein